MLVEACILPPLIIATAPPELRKLPSEMGEMPRCASAGLDGMGFIVD
jgi:hypothetical protein